MFFNTATVPLSVLQDDQVFGTCLESSLFVMAQFECSNPQMCISANGKSKYISFADEEFLSLIYEHETLQICFINNDVIRNVFGDVKEIFVQELCVINSKEFCSDPESITGASYVHIFGSKGTLPLVSNGTGLFD